MSNASRTVQAAIQEFVESERNGQWWGKHPNTELIFDDARFQKGGGHLQILLGPPIKQTEMRSQPNVMRTTNPTYRHGDTAMRAIEESFYG
jgi:hypothetical protein